MVTSFRVKTGCLTCRRRRKKCDERKPLCTGCARNFLECNWPKPAPGKDGATVGIESSKATKSESSLPRGHHTVFVVERPNSSSKVTTQSRPAEPSVEKADSPPFLADDTSGGSLAYWRAPTASFMSADRPILLTPHSFLLLQHYLEDTAAFLVPKPRKRNPFITNVLPLAYSDDLLMHSILALSGTHLSYQQSGHLDIQLATRNHYSSLLRGLRLAFNRESTEPCSKRNLRLLLILAVLCHIEAVSGEPYGGIFPHLRASRQLILNLLHKPDETMDDDWKRIKGFVLEVYTYLVLTNNITPYGRSEARTIPIDPFITSFELLRQYETFGVFVSCGHGLFENIPKISLFAMNRLAEEESANVCSSQSQQTYDELVSVLAAWEASPVEPEMAEFEIAHIATGEVYRQALFIFVKTAMCGSVVDSPKVMAEVQGHIETIQDQLPAIHPSPFITVLLWPLMIMGSCLTSPRARSQFLSLLKESSIEVMQLAEAANLLQKLWEDDDRRSFGPFGLHFTMQKHNINFSMA